MLFAISFHICFQRGILTQPHFVCKLLLTVLFYLCNAVCHCLLNEHDNNDDDGAVYRASFHHFSQCKPIAIKFVDVNRVSYMTPVAHF